MPSTEICRIVDQALAPGCFFIGLATSLRIERLVDEELGWELFLGHLLDPATSRRRERFVAWQVFLDDSSAPARAPILAVRWQPATEQLHVTRQILTHGFEAYEDAPGVIHTRPSQKWVTELVGSIETKDVSREMLEVELARLLFFAVIGTSRLPITSLESPLPDYSLGRLGYLAGPPQAERAYADPQAFLLAGLGRERTMLEQAKSLETALRAIPIEKIRFLTKVLEVTCGQPDRGEEYIARLVRTVFNTAALSPYTQFADALIELVNVIAATKWFGLGKSIDSLSYMLRHLCRHLTAFDLTLFHNFGANYPDALFLDALLKAYLPLVERASLPPNRLHRRALRQACLTRRMYEGHRVPDAPTSMGEHTRVLPAPLVRVPEEQIFETGKRRRRLFENDPTDRLLSAPIREMLAAGLKDLDDPRELTELGTAHYLDRPLGVLKAPGEVDRTPLLSYEAFSRFVAGRRLAVLKSAGWIDVPRHETLRSAIATLSPPGMPASELSFIERAGVVSLADANKAATDFVFLRTTRGSLDALLERYDWAPLAERFAAVVDWLLTDSQVLLVQHSPAESPQRPVLRAYAGGALRLELGFPSERTTMAIYRQHGGIEVARRLHLLRAWDAASESLVDVRESEIWIAAK